MLNLPVLPEFFCWLCQKSCWSHALLLEHLSTAHSDRIRFFCSVCKEAGMSQEEVVNHRMTVHAIETGLRCIGFTVMLDEEQATSELEETPSVAESSLTSRRTGRSFHCEDCSRIFSKQYILRRHQRKVHKGERKFQCRKCNSAFAEVFVLRRHVQTVHDKLKPYPCNYCGRLFGLKSNRDRHMKNLHTKLDSHSLSGSFEEQGLSLVSSGEGM